MGFDNTAYFFYPYRQTSFTFLAYFKPLRDFYGFTKVPDASKITRFKQDFLNDLQSVFDNLVNLTEPICQTIDSAKADMTIFDSSGIEAFVTENNPKYANRIIRQLKAYIPLNARSSLKNADYTINENGIPCCPLDEPLSMKYEGISKLKSGFTRYKFVCPKIKWVYDSATKNYHRECLCDTPCTPSKSGLLLKEK